MAGGRKHRRRTRGASLERDVKDRLIQTRVPERLESVLKEEAKKRRLTVSHLIRNVLEDTLNLVDSVVLGAGEIVDAAGGVADQLKRDAGRLAGSAREVVKVREPETVAPEALEYVLAWNQVVVNRPATCALCGAALGKGTSAHLGVSSDPTKPPAWLCDACVKKL